MKHDACYISEVTTTVAFSVRLHEDTTLNDEPLIFEAVDLNIGNGYNEYSGMLILQQI